MGGRLMGSIGVMKVFLLPCVGKAGMGRGKTYINSPSPQSSRSEGEEHLLVCHITKYNLSGKGVKISHTAAPIRSRLYRKPLSGLFLS
jgi:hypothetical protein